MSILEPWKELSQNINKKVWVDNPLRKVRNTPCPCGSGDKAKKCCGKYTKVKTYIGEMLKHFIKTGKVSSHLEGALKHEKRMVETDASDAEVDNNYEFTVTDIDETARLLNPLR